MINSSVNDQSTNKAQVNGMGDFTLFFIFNGLPAIAKKYTWGGTSLCRRNSELIRVSLAAQTVF